MCSDNNSCLSLMGAEMVPLRVFGFRLASKRVAADRWVAETVKDSKAAKVSTFPCHSTLFLPPTKSDLHQSSVQVAEKRLQ